MNDFTVHQDDLRWQYIVFVVCLQVSWNALPLLSCHQTINQLSCTFPTMPIFHATLQSFFLGLAQIKISDKRRHGFTPVMHIVVHARDIYALHGIG